MSSGRPSEHFSFLDLPRAVWFFLGPERWTFLFFMAVLLAVFCYVIVPPYIVGLTANFLIDYVKSGPESARSIAPLFWFAGSLAASYAGVALVRLSSKRMMGRISLNARYRAKVWGFERLLDSSLTWHQQESTGNKAQRLLTGAEAVREWTDSVLMDCLNAAAVIVSSMVACILLHPAFIRLPSAFLREAAPRQQEMDVLPDSQRHCVGCLRSCGGIHVHQWPVVGGILPDLRHLL
jgi:ABC-type multidrug transport system fused ATPase/permease subunit